MDRFDPRGVPTVAQLLRELDGAGDGADWEKTSLKPYVDLLDNHTMRILEEVRRNKRSSEIIILSVVYPLISLQTSAGDCPTYHGCITYHLPHLLAVTKCHRK